MKSYNVAVVGATGLVGRTFLEVLAEYNFPIKNLVLYASKRSIQLSPIAPPDTMRSIISFLRSAESRKMIKLPSSVQTAQNTIFLIWVLCKSVP